jgi:hypothetical protein
MLRGGIGNLSLQPTSRQSLQVRSGARSLTGLIGLLQGD